MMLLGRVNRICWSGSSHGIKSNRRNTRYDQRSSKSLGELYGTLECTTRRVRLVVANDNVLHRGASFLLSLTKTICSEVLWPPSRHPVFSPTRTETLSCPLSRQDAHSSAP